MLQLSDELLARARSYTEGAVKLAGYVEYTTHGGWNVRWWDQGRPGKRPGSSSPHRYKGLGSLYIESWEVGAALVEALTGRRPVRRSAPREYVDVERERGRQIVQSLRKTGFTDAQKRAAKERDGGCIGKGRYGECHDTQPLELCQVDHVDPDGPNALWNAQTLCGNCHDWKTAVENGWWTPRD